jgi:hypothetical protein
MKKFKMIISEERQDKQRVLNLYLKCQAQRRLFWGWGWGVGVVNKIILFINS